MEPWWRERNRRYYANNRWREIERKSTYYYRNREKVLAKRRRIYLVWSGKIRDPKKDFTWLKAEEYAERIALPKLGFTNIQNLNQKFSKFPFDFYAEKDGEKFLIDVTTAPMKNVNDGLDTLWKVLGLKRLVLFVKPDFCRIFLKEVEDEKSHVWLTKREILQK